ncbi:stage V sporulation protein D [Clostridium sp. DL1XJH146]
MAVKKYIDKVKIKKRMLGTAGILLFLFFVLVVKLFYIMIIKSNDYKSIAITQWANDVTIAPRRGDILDRNGQVLATSVNVYRADLDLNVLRITLEKNNISNEEFAKMASDCVDVTEEKILSILAHTEWGDAILARRINKEGADELEALNLYGINISPDVERVYPNGELDGEPNNGEFLSHVLGHTNSDGSGLAGVELQYNTELSGVNGVKISEINGYEGLFPSYISEFVDPIEGKDVVLTIDSTLQLICENAAEQAMIDNKANAVTIIISDPSNGEILAMVNEPDYDLNDPWVEGESYEELQQSWRNRAVSDTYEPGSIFKVVTATAAMAEKVIDEDTFTVICNGSVTIGKRIIHCWKTTGHGTQSFVDILKNSCNVGFMKLAELLGVDKLYKHIDAFGLGHKTGIDLPGEAAGIIKSAEDVTETDLATISFGQTNTLTPIQYVTIMNAIANGGTYYTPHVMKDITHYDDEGELIIDEQYEDENIRVIEDKEVMDRLRGYLEKVVSEGGGKKAYVESYHIGGKTGTAQKVVDSVYAEKKYIASFGGMAPILPGETPKITVFISIDEPDPSNYYAGQIAAPVAKEVFVNAFNYLDIANEEYGEKALLEDVVVPEVRGFKKAEAISSIEESNLSYKISGEGDYIVNMMPKPGYTLKETSEIILYTGNGSVETEDVVMPNLIGLNTEKAEDILNKLGVEVTFLGEGLVSEQSISPGQSVLKGQKVVLQLENIPD